MPRLAPTMSTEGAPLATGAGASWSAKRATLPAAVEECIILARWTGSGRGGARRGAVGRASSAQALKVGLRMGCGLGGLGRL